MPPSARNGWKSDRITRCGSLPLLALCGHLRGTIRGTSSTEILRHPGRRLASLAARRIPCSVAEIPCSGLRNSLFRSWLLRGNTRKDAGQHGSFSHRFQRRPIANSLLFSLLAGNIRGERFVADCLHRQQVHEPSLRAKVRLKRGPLYGLSRVENNHHTPHKLTPTFGQFGSFRRVFSRPRLSSGGFRRTWVKRWPTFVGRRCPKRRLTNITPPEAESPFAS